MQYDKGTRQLSIKQTQKTFSDFKDAEGFLL